MYRTGREINMRILVGVILFFGFLALPVPARPADCRDSSVAIKAGLDVYVERGDTARQAAVLESAAKAEEACAERQPASGQNNRDGYRYYAAIDYSRAADLLRKAQARWTTVVALYEVSSKLLREVLPGLRQQTVFNPVILAQARAEIAVNDDYIKDVMPSSDGILHDASGMVKIYPGVSDCQTAPEASPPIFSVSSGTHVSVSGDLFCHPNGTDSFEVEILDGPERGRTGVVLGKSLVRVKNGAIP